MTRTLRPGFDRIVRTAPLGVQFRDVLDRRVVSDGLRVDVWDAQRPDRPLGLHASPSGVFVAHALPGISGFGGQDVTSPMPTGEDRFRLSVRDPLGRYVEASIALALPGNGLFEPACLHESPPHGLPHVPLYSAATRPLPSALAVVRSDLRLASNHERPASWARLELWLGAVRLAIGVADAHGTVLLLAPLPAPREPTRRASPPAGFERAVWDVSLRAYWNAAHYAQPVPDVCDVHLQPEVGLLRTRAPATPLGELQLRAGEPLIVRAADSSFLFVAA
jgi:hypothetical protein